MKELLAQGLEKYMSNEQKTNVLRENLQVMILKNLSDRGAFKNLSFVGGTALRIIHGLNRFSEDLDFSLSNKKGFDFDGIATGLADDLDKAGLAHTAKKGGKGEVKFLFMKFPGLFSEFGAGRLKAENLGVKIEVDMKPPEGWENETVLINRFYIFQVNCYKLPSRDYYDLLWYLTKKVKPNYDMLSNAAQHSEKKKKEINAQNLPVLLLKKLESVNFKAVESDVAKFLNNPEEAKLLNLETFKMLLKNIS